MRKLFLGSISIIVLFIMLPISCSDNVQDSQGEKLNLDTFASSEAFNRLMVSTEKVITTQGDHFLTVDKNNRAGYIEKLANLTEGLKKNPTEENLKQFVDHAGFNTLNEFMSLYQVQESAKKHLSEQFPLFADLNNDKKSAFLQRAATKLKGNDTSKEDKDNLAAGPCEDKLAAKRKIAFGVATAALVGCGELSAGPALVNVFVGAAIYGVCAGTVYSTYNAELDLAQLEYEDCIS